MKEWIKYTISIMIFIIFLNFWLIYQVQLSQIAIFSILVSGPTLISLFFVFRMLKTKKIYYRLGFAILVVTTVTLPNIYFSSAINHMIDNFSTDIETGMFIFLVLYLVENILLTSSINVFQERLKHKINIAT
jgi:hypothetical protein